MPDREQRPETDAETDTRTPFGPELPRGPAPLPGSPFLTQMTGWGQAQAQAQPASSSSGPPDLDVSPFAIDLGTVTRGETRYETVFITNHEATEVWIADVRAERALSFTPDFPASTRLDPGASMAVDVRYDAVTVGLEQGNIVVETSDGFEIRVPVAVTCAPKQPKIKIDPRSYHFGGVEQGKSAAQHSFTVTNHETEDVSILIRTSGPPFSGDSRGYYLPIEDITLGAGKSVPVDVWFFQKELGEVRGQLIVETMDGDAMVECDLTGSVIEPVPDLVPEPEPPPAPKPPPAPEPPPEVEKALRVSPDSLKLVAVAGRETMPLDVRIANPNEQSVAVSAEIVTKGNKPTPFALERKELYLTEYGSRGEAESLGVTYAPGAEGEHTATLRLSYAQRTEDIPLEGTALPPAADDHKTAEGRVISPELPEAETPGSKAEGEQQLAQAADALSTLPAVHDQSIPHFRTAAETFVDECGTLLGGFNQSLITWMKDEGDARLQQLVANDDLNIMSYVMSIAALPSSAAGMAIDTIFLAFGMNETKKTNAKIEKGLQDNAFVADMLGRAASSTQKIVVNQLGTEMRKFGDAEGRAREIAGAEAMLVLDQLGKLMDASYGRRTATRTADAYADARRLMGRFQNALDDATVAMREIAQAAADLRGGLPRALHAMKEKYLEYLATGKSSRTGEQFQVTMMGSVNFDTPWKGRSFHAYYYPDYTRFEGENTVDPHDLSSTMSRHVHGKRLSDLPAPDGDARAAWSAKIELSSAQDGELVMRQSAKGERSASISGPAVKNVEKAGGVAEIWAALDELSLFG